MSVQYRIKGQVLVVSFVEGSTSEEIFQAIHRAFEDPDCPKGANLLLDLRASTSLQTRSVERIRSISQVILSHPSRPGRKIAILLAQSEEQRLAPMAAEFEAETGIEIQVFVTMATASKWLVGDATQIGEG